MIFYSPHPTKKNKRKINSIIILIYTNSVADFFFKFKKILTIKNLNGFVFTWNQLRRKKEKNHENSFLFYYFKLPWGKLLLCSFFHFGIKINFGFIKDTENRNSSYNSQCLDYIQPHQTMELCMYTDLYPILLLKCTVGQHLRDAYPCHPHQQGLAICG